MANYTVGVDVGGTKVACGIFEDHRLLETVKMPSDRTLTAEEFTDTILAQIRGLLQNRGAGLSQLAGVGLCVPSFIDYETRRVVFTANLPNLNHFAICDYVEQSLGVPARLDNDGNAAALAEHCYGAGRGTKNMLYCAVSTGLGLGIIIGGRIFRGDNGWAGESGHMIADPAERADYESHISGAHIVKRLAEKIRNGETSELLTLCGGNLESLSAKHLLEAFHQGDSLARWGVEHMAHYLGVWAYNLYMTFNINTYVFGGGLVHFGDPLLGKAHQVMCDLNHGETRAVFKTAELGENFGVIGAAELLSEE